MNKDQIFSQFPVLKTKRLTLRALTRDDAEEVFKMRSNLAVNRFIARPEMENPESAERLIERTLQFWENKEAIAWAGILRDHGNIIGTCGFNFIDFANHRAEIGGELGTDFWGKNLAFEAVQAIINYGFDKIGLHSIEAKVSPENRGALSLLESVGFIREAYFRERIYFLGKYLDMAVYTCHKPG